MSRDYRDMVITELADSEAEWRERADQLLGVIAKLAHENFILRRLWEREFLERVHGDRQLERERAKRYAQRDRMAA